MHGRSYVFRLKVAASQATGDVGARQQEQEYDLVRNSILCLCVYFVVMRAPTVDAAMSCPQPRVFVHQVTVCQIRLIALQLLAAGAREHGSFCVKYCRLQVTAVAERSLPIFSHLTICITSSTSRLHQPRKLQAAADTAYRWLLAP